MFNIIVGNSPLTGFLSVKVETDFEDLTNRFNILGGRADGDLNNRFYNQFGIGVNTPYLIDGLPTVGQRVRISLRDVPLIDGYVTGNEISGGKAQTFSANGYDKTIDLIQSSAPIVSFSGGITLKSLIDEILALLQIRDIEVIDEARRGRLPDNQQISSNVGQNAFDFLSKYADLQGVFLVADGEGNIVIKDGKAIEKYIIDPEFNNEAGGILGSSFSVDANALYNTYESRSQLDFDSVKGTAIDNSIRKGRFHVKITEQDVGSIEEAQNRSIWAMAVRRSQAVSYSFSLPTVLVPTESGESKIIKAGSIVTISDKRLGIDRLDYFIRGCEYNSSESGVTVKLNCIPNGAYQR